MLRYKLSRGREKGQGPRRRGAAMAGRQRVPAMKVLLGAGTVALPVTRPGPDDVGDLKAELIAAGRLSVPRELLAGYRLSRSTAGPGAGGASIALGWTGPDGREHRLKLAVSRDGDAPLRLAKRPDGALEVLRRDGTVALAVVRLLPIAMHAPDHCFINLEGDCVYDCAFCTATRPGSGEGRGAPRSPQRWVELIVASHRRRPFDGVAITSVDTADHEALMRNYEAVISGVVGALPGVVLGVEPPARSAEDIERLHRAGATELKINIQTPDVDILARVCPGWDLERQCALLREGVRVFGRGRVTSNVIIGLGEADADVMRALDRLAAAGVVPTLRVLRVSDLNRGKLESALGRPLEPVAPARHVRLARALGEALAHHGLSARAFRTMCHSCMGCDLEPGVDI